MAKCPVCGHELSYGALSCPSCGTGISWWWWGGFSLLDAIIILVPLLIFVTPCLILLDYLQGLVRAINENFGKTFQIACIVTVVLTVLLITLFVWLRWRCYRHRVLWNILNSIVTVIYFVTLAVKVLMYVWLWSDAGRHGTASFAIELFSALIIGMILFIHDLVTIWQMAHFDDMMTSETFRGIIWNAAAVGGIWFLLGDRFSGFFTILRNTVS